MYEGYRGVRELNEDELRELKGKLFWQVYCGDNGSGEYMTDEQYAIVDSAKYLDDIPDELIFNVFDGTDFVEEDFWCNIPDRS